MDPRLAALMGLAPRMAQPMQAPPNAMGVAQPQFPVTPYNPSMMERMFPENGMEGLLGRDALSGMRRQGLLQMGLSLLGNSGQSLERRGLGELLAGGFQAGQQGYQNAVGGALQGQQVMAELAQQKLQAERQQAFDQIAKKYKPVPGESAEDRRARMAGMISEFIAADPAGMGGKLNAFASVFDAPKAEANKGVRTMMVEVEGGGQQLINAETGEVIKQYGAKPALSRGEGKAPTQGQETAAGFAHRMINAERLVDALEQSGVALPDQALLFSPSTKKGAAIYASLNPEQQKYVTIMSDWIRAKLRKESGAVISDEEWVNEGRGYFRVFGDKPGLPETKRQLRRTANWGIVRQAGGAYELAPDDSVFVDDGKKRDRKVVGGSSSTAPAGLDRYFK